MANEEETQEALGLKTEELEAALAAARPLDIKVLNGTGLTLKFHAEKPKHGKVPVCHPAMVTNNDIAHIHVENSGLIGPEGNFELGSFKCYYHHPFGTGLTEVSWTPPPGYKDTRVYDSLQQHAASCIDWLIKT